MAVRCAGIPAEVRAGGARAAGQVRAGGGRELMMARKQNKSHKQPKQAPKIKISRNSLKLIKDVLTLIGGLAGSILAVYGLIKTFKEDAAGFSWLIPVGAVIWAIILWRMLQTRKTAAYSLFIVSMVIGVVGWIGWQSQVHATEDKVVVLVTQFDGPEETFGLRRQMMEDLREATKDYGDTIIIEGDKLVTSGEYARELGKREKADLVIWAWYRPTEDPNVTIHIENLSPKEIDLLQESETYQPNTTLAELESFEIQRQLGSETSTLVSFVTALLCLKNGDYQTALERLNKVILEGDTSTYIDPFDLQFYKGYVHSVLGQFEQSIQYYTKAIELNPNSFDAFNNRGGDYINLEKPDSAIVDLNRAIELNADNFIVYFNRGVAYHDLMQYDRAIDNYNKTTELNPYFAQAYFNLGIAYADLGQYELSIQHYSKAIALDTEAPYAYINRAAIYQVIGQYENAIRDYNQVIKIDRDFPSAYSGRGNAYQKLGKITEAEADFKKYEELTGQKP